MQEKESDECPSYSVVSFVHYTASEIVISQTSGLLMLIQSPQTQTQQLFRPFWQAANGFCREAAEADGSRWLRLADGWYLKYSKGRVTSVTTEEKKRRWKKETNQQHHSKKKHTNKAQDRDMSRYCHRAWKYQRSFGR